MTKQLSTLLAATFASALLLSGCGKAPATAPGVRAIAAATAAQSAKSIFGKDLVIEQVTARLENNDEGLRRQQVFCLTGTVDGAPFELGASTFFPYYVPMFGKVTVNGKDHKMTPEVAKALVKLIKAADKPPVASQNALSQLMYGLTFWAGHEIGGLAQ